MTSLGKWGRKYLHFHRFFVTLNLFQGLLASTVRSMRDERQPCVYILASRPRGTLYVGVTSNLAARLWQHRNNALPGFTARNQIHLLAHLELFGEMEPAILREKQLKNWHRDWKLNLIEGANPQWADLAVGLGLPPMGRG